jgi:Ser/Thr protein kinase RdoA (MazF antagonist)
LAFLVDQRQSDSGENVQERHQVFYKAAANGLKEYDLAYVQLDDSGVAGDVGFEGCRMIKFRAGGERPGYLVTVYAARAGRSVHDQRIHIQSHHAWLEALARDTELTVQDPVRNRDGDAITTVSRERGTTFLVTVLRWVDGELVLDDDADRAPPDFPPSVMSGVGTLLGKLHRHSLTWDRPGDFSRPENESERVSDNMARLRDAGYAKRIPQSSVEVVGRAIQLYKAELSAVKSPETWGLVHGDFKCGNCVRLGDRINPIDLDWCCFGYFLGDIGWSFVVHDMSRTLREALLVGYAEQISLDEGAIRLIEGTFIEAWVRLEGWCSGNETHRFEGLPHFVEAACRPYLDGETFVMDWVDEK